MHADTDMDITRILVSEYNIVEEMLGLNGDNRNNNNGNINGHD